MRGYSLKGSLVIHTSETLVIITITASHISQTVNRAETSPGVMRKLRFEKP